MLAIFPGCAIGVCAHTGTDLPLVNGHALRVGPFYPTVANSMSWVVEDRVSVVACVGWFNEGGYYYGYSGTDPGAAWASWRPLAAALDSSFYATSWTADKAHVRLRWAVLPNGAVAGVIDSDGPASVTLHAVPGWKAFPKVAYRVANGSLIGESKEAKLKWSLRARDQAIPTMTLSALKTRVGSVAFAAATDPTPIADGDQAVLFFKVSASEPVTFSAGLGDLLELDKVDSTVAEAENRYEASRPRFSGKRDELLDPINVQMNISRLYSPRLKYMAHTISRGWCFGDTIRLFCWDSFFNGLLANRVDPVGGRDTVRAILATQTPSGFISNVASDADAVKPADSDRSQPPVGAMAVWRMHQRQPDRAFLEEAYPKLVKWHDWWFATNPETGKPNRDGNRNGLLEWGSSTGHAQPMKFETGLDDSPAYDEIEPDLTTKTMRMDAVDLNSLWAMDAEYLGKMAEALGKPEEARRFQEEVKTMNRRMNELLWDEEAGLYANRYWEKRLVTFGIQPETIPAACWRTPAGGQGLQVEYFKGLQIDKSLEMKTVPLIDINNEGQRVLAKTYGDEKNQLSFRWTGKLIPEQTGLYALSMETRGYSRLWLDGRLILNQTMAVVYPHLRTQPLMLEAGKSHEFKAEYLAPDYTGIRMVWFRVPEPAPAPRIFSGRFAVTCFYPMLSGAPAPERAQRMLNILRDEKRFWGEYICPTISRDDPAFPEQHYWRGKIWGPTNYLLWLGLQRYADDALLDAYAQKSVALFLPSWNADHTCNENYLTNGKGGGDPHYTWGALLCLIGIERREAEGQAKTNGK